LKGLRRRRAQGAGQRNAEGAILFHDIAHREDFERMAAAVFETLPNSRPLPQGVLTIERGKVLAR
jgi:hypothetical protein